jgi:hypothetical protein
MLPAINTFLIVILYVLLGLMIYRPNVYVNLNINKNDVPEPVSTTESHQPSTTKQQPITTKQQPITTKQQPITTKQHPTTTKQHPTTTKQVKFNDELMVKTDNTKQYAGCTGVFNGNHKIYIQDDNEYKLLTNVMDKHRNNRIHSIRSSYRNRQNYPSYVKMLNVVIN